MKQLLSLTVIIAGAEFQSRGELFEWIGALRRQFPKGTINAINATVFNPGWGVSPGTCKVCGNLILPSEDCVVGSDNTTWHRKDCVVGKEEA